MTSHHWARVEHSPMLFCKVVALYETREACVGGTSPPEVIISLAEGTRIDGSAAPASGPKPKHTFCVSSADGEHQWLIAGSEAEKQAWVRALTALVAG
jgi:hypothetical protein